MSDPFAEMPRGTSPSDGGSIIVDDKPPETEDAPGPRRLYVMLSASGNAAWIRNNDNTAWEPLFGTGGGGGGGGGGGTVLAPATTVQSETAFGQVPVVGSDVTYAREDHTHGTPTVADMDGAVSRAVLKVTGVTSTAAITPGGNAAVTTHTADVHNHGNGFLGLEATNGIEILQAGWYAVSGSVNVTTDAGNPNQHVRLTVKSAAVTTLTQDDRKTSADAAMVHAVESDVWYLTEGDVLTLRYDNLGAAGNVTVTAGRIEAFLVWPETAGGGESYFTGDAFAALLKARTTVDDSDGLPAYDGTGDAAPAGFTGEPLVGPFSYGEVTDPYLTLVAEQPDLMVVRIEAAAGLTGVPGANGSISFSVTVNDVVVGTDSIAVTGGVFFEHLFVVDLRNYLLHAGDVVSVTGTDHKFWGNGGVNETYLRVGRGTYDFGGGLTWEGP